uniref:Betaine--homocysteine S-methyltransferase 1 n=1 Tax=Myotis myotis TaxID=51298 RepID=A0A7J7XXE6_MYOMY|nr:betaine--homocysteine S-methyltransferase [Myotis myotis]
MAPIGGKKAKKGILERLNSGEVVIGDGGFVFSLEKRGYVKAGPWTPEAAVEHPEAVRQLHREFLRAGSNVMQTFTFYASEDKLENRGNYVAEKISGQKVNEAACDIARQVADEGDALVAGGVSQTPSYLSCKSETEVKKVFQQQLEVFMKKNVDFLIAEYFEHVEEAVWAVEALKASGKPVAATMCCGFEPYHIRAIAEELAPERGFLPPASEKHGSWGSGLDMHTKPWIRARARKEYWENLRIASGRPYNPSMSKPDAWGVTKGTSMLMQQKEATTEQQLRELFEKQKYKSA